jgi:lysophospholipase L1-like esterase
VRILSGRGYWLPRSRIPHLRRLAFLGDSFVYGQGVAPDETLPACAERQLNEMATGWPIEAVNLGVYGYNLWNAWQSFRNAPQVYDAVVLTLCTNDAELFGRSYRVTYGPGLSGPLWQPTHRYRESIIACFDDIAAFRRSSNLPVAVCFYSVWPGLPLAEQAGNRHISKLVADLCAARGIAYVDFFAHFTERNLSPDALVVSEADHHPSKMAHDAAARYLALSLRQLGWFERMGAATFGRVADRIQLAAQDLVGRDSYPSDIALRWATGALEGKRRAAKRMQSASEAADFASRADRVAAALESARALWHGAQRAAAVGEEARGAWGYNWSLWRIDEEMLKVEELCATIGKVELNGLIPEQDSTPTSSEDGTVPGLFGSTCLALGRVCAALEAARTARGSMRQATMESSLQSPEEVGRSTSDLADIDALSDRAENAAYALLRMLERHGASTAEAAGRLPQAEHRRLLGLLQSSLESALQGLESVEKKLASVTAPPAPAFDYSLIEATLAVEVVEGRHPCRVEVLASYLTPRRLALRDHRYILPRGSPVVVSLRLPVIYAGYLLLSFDSPGATGGRAAVDLVKVEIRNSTAERRSLDRTAFTRQANGSLVSRIFYMA